MTPEISSSIDIIEEVAYPSYTYRLDLENKRVQGHVDGIEAITQAASKILLTQREAYLIYDKYYGTPLEDYIGAEFDFVNSDIERGVSESLLYDDRISSIENFSFEQIANDSASASFNILSTEGKNQLGMEVQL